MFKAALYGFLLINVCTGYAGDNDFFAARRNALMDRIGNSIAVLQGLSDSRAYVAFRQDNSFYYLTGVETPDAMLLLDGSRRRSILFLPPRNKEQEKWEGSLLYAGREALRRTGVDAVMSLPEFGAELKKRVEDSRIVYTPFMPFEAAATSRDRAVRYDDNRMESAWDGRIGRNLAKSLTEEENEVYLVTYSEIHQPV